MTPDTQHSGFTPDVRSFFEPESFTWTHLVADPASGDAALVDPVWVYDPVTGQTDRSFIDEVLASLEASGWTLKWILETHAHADHLSSGDLVRRETGVPLVIGAGIRGVQRNFARVYNLADLPVDGSQFDHLATQGDRFPLGDRFIEVMNTPGHTGDSVTYLVGDAAFVGDTLFAPGYGSARCDFPGGDAGQLFDSIQALHGLPDETRLFLCHDYPKANAEPVSVVTVAESRANNIHVGSNTSREEFIAMREARDATLGLPRLILPALQVNVRAGGEPAPESNGASYLKIPFNTTIPELLSEE
ncbi:MAG: MBL fold metallo-hydrolase [Xanthomonadales bacterium]|jgi:glyoxylase-like metal-dependent hydrolase (beta-lactamase superfamily II)|nr:MBL fold metallo-hydrolase [Xanthomonadales bacterium]